MLSIAEMTISESFTPSLLDISQNRDIEVTDVLVV